MVTQWNDSFWGQLWNKSFFSELYVAAMQNWFYYSKGFSVATQAANPVCASVQL